MYYARCREVDMVERLLQDSRVLAGVNLQDDFGCTALHAPCSYLIDYQGSAKIQILLQAGAEPSLKN